MGKALRDGYREKAFLMTKIDGRSGREATRQLDDSLTRLGVDRIDLVPHYEILRFEDPHRIFDPDGANAALVAAREAGKIRRKWSKTVTPIECLPYALNLPTSVMITGIDSMEILEQAVEAVKTFHPMNDAELRPILAKTAAPAAGGAFEPFKRHRFSIQLHRIRIDLGKNRSACSR